MKNIQNKKAFSLIELSIVLLIIGIIIAGVTQSSRLVRQFKLSTARSQTQSSAAASVNGMILWLESTSTASFLEAEADNETAVSAWYDINPTGSVKYNATQSSANLKPYYYSNCINGLPCLRFNDSVGTMPNTTYTDWLDFASLPPLINTDYTVFVVEQRRTTTANYFIAGSVSATAEGRLTLGYSGDQLIRFDQGAATSTNYYTAAVDAYSIPQPVLHVFINGYGYNGTDNGYYSGEKSYFRNGSATANVSGTGLTAVGTPTDTNLTTSWTSLQIAKATIATTTSYYAGDIGEIIIFNRALKAEERVAIEDYLLKKWGILGAS